MSGAVPQARVLGWIEKKATPALTSLRFPSTDAVWPAALRPPQPMPLSLPCSLDRLHPPNLGAKVNLPFLKLPLSGVLSQQWKQKRKRKKRRGRREAPSISQLGSLFLQYWAPPHLVSLLATFQHRLWHPLHNNAKDAVGISPPPPHMHTSTHLCAAGTEGLPMHMFYYVSYTDHSSLLAPGQERKHNDSQPELAPSPMGLYRPVNWLSQRWELYYSWILF